MKITVQNLKGKKVEDINLSEKVFGLKKNDDLLHQVMVAIYANARQPLAHTKTRGDRAGSGRKPWRQKGTGRARVGSVRTPLWKKGGVVFGPRSNRNYSQKVNKKMKAKAIAVALSGKVRDKEMIVVDKIELPEKRTQKMAEALANLKTKGKTLVAFHGKEKDFQIASRNLVRVTNTAIEQLNVWQMLNNKYLVMSKDSVRYLENKYGTKKKDK